MVKAEAAKSDDKSITAAVDKFMEAKKLINDKTELVFTYLKELSDDVDNSQLVQAELAYLYFSGDECPLLYALGPEAWYSYDYYWRVSSANLTRIKVLFQTGLLKAMQAVARKARSEETWPKAVNGEEHFRLVFLGKFVLALSNRESVEKIIKESTMSRLLLRPLMILDDGA
jgi:hypothetical protein